MIDNIVFVRELNSALKYLPNKNDNSFYKTYKMPKGTQDRQIRVSSHGTYLKFWIEQTYDPSCGCNISIVFTKNGIPTNDCYIDTATNEPFKDCRPCLDIQKKQGTGCKPRRVPNYNQKKREFYVTQYIYNCEYFDGSEIDKCVIAIKNAAQTGEYIDPFKGIKGKECIKVTLQPIQENNNTKIQNTMKQRIRLTEGDLHRIIRNCVNEALNEISIDLLQNAQDKANDDYEEHMWCDNDGDEEIADRRYRQKEAFKDRIHQLKSQGGKQVYYLVRPGLPSWYDGDIRKVYLRPDEIEQYAKEHGGKIYDDYAKACKAADCTSD